jgi:gluconolactonase
MKRVLSFSLFFMLVLTGLCQKTKTGNTLIEKGAVVTKAGGGYTFTEGSSVAKDGRVFFTDQPNDKIEIWDENGNITTFMQPCERSNGTFFNKKGDLVACADLHNRLVLFTMDKQLHIVAENFNGKHLNGPNDLWIAPNGDIYFTDPYYHRNYWETGHKEAQDLRGVYLMKQNGEIIRVIDDYKQPNGLVGTKDGKTLYVSDINDKKIWKYSILPNGTLSNKTLFAPEGSDGMTIDTHGNIYLTNKVVSVYNRKGENIERIEFPEQPSNLCFGGKKRNILFVTARTSVYTLRMKTKGIE